MYRRPAAAAVLLATVLSLSLTACSSGGDEPAAEAKPKPPAASSVPDPADSSAAPAVPTPPAAKPTGPVLPDAKLTPATGSFKDNEKKYLSGRVPEKTDPAAVLQTGQDSCQRIERTAKRDRNAAVAAIVSGEIVGAKDAVTYLCPEQKPVLAAAEKGFGDGTRKSPAAGTYRAATPTASCSWQAKSANGAVLASGPDTGAKPGAPVTAKIPAGTAEFVSAGCYAWLPA
ncbi:hypothetical protein [Streptomyces sp. NPDC089799]|uniref:hypothetical protein n=1 Tax=Streptomyces sp. NPDC089799 TaxID=3155066 RepID=UPI00342805C8